MLFLFKEFFNCAFLNLKNKQYATKYDEPSPK
jgi:hypothetical protein